MPWLTNFNLPDINKENDDFAIRSRALAQQRAYQEVLANQIRQKMQMQQQMFPGQKNKQDLGNQMSTVRLGEEREKAPFAGRNLASEIDFRRANTRYYNSPQFTEKNLSPLGKAHVESKVIPAVKNVIQHRTSGQGISPSLYDQYYPDNPGAISATNNGPNQTTGQFIGANPQGQAPKENIIANQPNTLAATSNDISDQGSENPVQQKAAQQALDDSYKLKRLKDVSDAQARQKALYATNIDQTLKFINPDDLTQYSGIMGSLKKHVEQAQSAFGSPSDKYQNYLQAANASHMLAKQVRQFYGDSIRPSMIARLEHITNPESWDRDPETAKKIFMQTKKILQTELATYRNAFKTRKAFESPQQKSTDKIASAPKYTIEDINAEIEKRKRKR